MLLKAMKSTLPVVDNYKEKIKKQEESLKDNDTPILKKKLISSVITMLVLMIFSMGHHFGISPKFIEMMPSFYNGLIQMILSLVVLCINRRFFISGIKAIRNHSPNMDTLVAMGSGISWLWSVWILLNLYSEMNGTIHQTSASMAFEINNYTLSDLYFESAAMIVTLITVGKLLESISKGKTTNALKSLLKIVPDTATVIRDGQEMTVVADHIRHGEVVVVKTGDRIPVDGIVIEGNAAVDESALTGESLPVNKLPGDRVSAATMNQSGYIKVETISVGEDTSVAEIIRLVSDAATDKAPIARIADRISGVFVPCVIGLATIVFIIWMILGQNVSYSLTRAVSVLLISCPCALGLATPVAIMVGNGVGAKNGILYKSASALEASGQINVIALDKTGTITYGKPSVKAVIPAHKVKEDDLLSVASALEGRSEHPLAKAISSYCKTTTVRISDFSEVAGGGVKAFVTEQNKFSSIAGGSSKFMREIGIREDEIESFEAEILKDDELRATSLIYFEKGGNLLGVIALSDTIKEDSRQAVEEMKKMGLRTVMITGDRNQVAKSIAEGVGVDDFYAEVMPVNKEAVIREIMKDEKIAMVGDGINDAPSLTRADVGIAIGAGTDVAIDAADIVLVNSKLTDAAKAIKLGRKTLLNIYENFFWAFIYNILLIPLAAGAFTSVLGGWTLSPMLAAGAMSFSSLCVCLNALRLNLVKL